MLGNVWTQQCSIGQVKGQTVLLSCGLEDLNRANLESQGCQTHGLEARSEVCVMRWREPKLVHVWESPCSTENITRYEECLRAILDTGRKEGARGGGDGTPCLDFAHNRLGLVSEDDL